MDEHSNQDKAVSPGYVGFSPTDGGCAQIWNKVCHTNPAYTAPFSMSGFAGTAIAPMYLVMQATHTFGPMGIGWGVEIVEQGIDEGTALGWDSSGNFWGNEKIHWVLAKLWFRHTNNDGSCERGEIFQYGSTVMVGKTADSISSDHDARKKSLTDATSKCLSLLGFGADVHMNLFSDNKYVEGLNALYGSPKNQHLQSTKPDGEQPLPSKRDAGEQERSARYQQLKERLDNEKSPIADPSLAKDTIRNDPLLSKFEISMLLSHKRFIEEAPEDFPFL